MSSTFYLRRTLLSEGRTYSEEELLEASNYIVVLAEPGAGKTELLGSLALQLCTSKVSANMFSHVGAEVQDSALVIDAFDELAKIDQSGIHRLLTNARKATPQYVIVSSRSSEWEYASTQSFTEFLGHRPLVVQLCEFNRSEQQEIFEHHLPGEDFSAFESEVTRFDLEPLLPNPQFLKLFSDAYVQSGRRFTDKREIFSQAVERLAKEANSSVSKAGTSLSISQKVELSSEVFAKILLSGAEGVCTNEAAEETIYPLLSSLISRDDAIEGILATRLFKLGDSEDYHIPIHKIVAEYCAAGYLTKRIADPADVLTLQKCLPVIAPNSTVRDELRGLLGWMAALGTGPVQEAAIDFDPYAVLANGDPSQLEPSSKLRLINRLREVEIQDPYFRRGDFGRRFSVAGFFTQDVIEEIKSFLLSGADGHLRYLILELLHGTSAAPRFMDEFRILALTSVNSDDTRLLASKCLRDIAGYEHRGILAVLIFEASRTSLKIAAETIAVLGPETFERKYLVGFFRVCANLYSRRQDQNRTFGQLYFLKILIAKLDLTTIEWLLDELTKDLSCACGQSSFNCHCRNGISKIVGNMLDLYFGLAPPPYDPIRVWAWVSNLSFSQAKAVDQSKAVQVLREDTALRQGIMTHVFGKLTDREQICTIQMEKFDFHSHSGLQFWADDYEFLIDLAFHTDNQYLWSNFIQRHRRYRSKADLGPDRLRRHMREQALDKQGFMREWAKANRSERNSDYGLPRRHTRRMKRRNREEEHIRAANIKFVQDNRELIEGGSHWGCLNRFAELVLMNSGDIEKEFGDEKLVRTALRNCLNFINDYVVDLDELAELQCASKGSSAVRILYAACLEILNTEGGLERVDRHLLRALRTDLNVHYNCVSSEERESLTAEIDRLIFPNTLSAERFLREYLEPQLRKSDCSHPELWLLNEEPFTELRADLSTEWLRSFQGLPLSQQDQLFDIAAQYGNHDELNDIIADRCAALMADGHCPTIDSDVDQIRTFWLLRGWCFLPNVPKIYWEWLVADSETLLVLYDKYGRMSRSDYPYWPALTANKVESILEAFIERWPEVNLPDSYGTDSAKEENAYRFLTEVVWATSTDDPDYAIPVIGRLLANPRFAVFHRDLRSIQASQLRKKALKDFEPPTPKKIVDLLDDDEVVTVEGLRQLVIQELQAFQKAIDGGEFNSADRFYEKGERLGEERCTEIVGERLNVILQHQGVSVTLEHQLKDTNRSDFTVSKVIGGKRRLLVAEVKGQWHKDLYAAASDQLYDRYSIHPDAEQQGIFLVIWFGISEKVAGRVNREISSAQELKDKVENLLPVGLKGLIDVFVLDVSKP